MAIKISCAKCQSSFVVRDEFGGKAVKCPKCSSVLRVPEQNGVNGPIAKIATASTKTRTGPATATATKAMSASSVAKGLPPAPRFNPLLDLLDEAGVKGRSQGPVCESCGAEMSPTAIICVQCGFNLATGQKLATAVLISDDDMTTAGLTDTEKIMAKAEKDIDDMPVSAFGQDFGEGNESFLIAMVALIGLLLFVGLGVVTILMMDQLGDLIKPERISLIAAIVIAVGCMIYITTIAFLSSTAHGIGCVASGGLYCIIFAFFQGRGMIIPAIILAASLLIGFVSLLFVMYPGVSETGFLLNPNYWTAWIAAR